MRYSFEGFEVLEQERQLWVAGRRVAVGARAFDVLLALVQHPARVVTKAELLDRVWPGEAVEENNVQVHISSLRKLLGQQAIATIPGRGYRVALAPLRLDSAPLPATAAPPPTVSRRTNLPERLPPLYGRASELERLRSLLDRHPIVSLVATGGIGKTHLARALAGAARQSFADGVWCIELAALARGDLVAAEVAQVLGYQVPAGRTATEVVVAVLRQQRALLLLDNCENVLQDVAQLVAAIHAAAPQVRMLVTSQKPLKTPGERIHRLDTLALPEAPGLASAQGSGAVQMLVHRIQAASPQFMLTAANADRLAALCQRLEGIPLAIEFAAARVPVLGLDGLLARLDERLKVLTVSAQQGLARHQTLRAALEFSHGLLEPDEQAVFRRIGVFCGSFSADAAQALAADAAIDRWAVLDHLGGLVEKSLLLADDSEPPRLRLLETTRAFALERLAAAGEDAAWHERHARVTAARMEQAAEQYWQCTDAQLRERYGVDNANLRAALAWALANDGELAIALAGNACALWREALLQQPEGARWCEAALPLVSERTPPLAAGRLHYALGWMLIWSQQQRGRAAALKAADYLRRTDDRATLSMTLLLLIPGTTTPDAHQAAVVEELRNLYDPDAPPRMQAACVSAFARYAMGTRRYDEALQRYAEARGLLARAGAVQWEGVLAWTMAGIAMATGQPGLAATTLRDTAAHLEAEPVHGIFLAFCLGSLATAHLLQAQAAPAREALERAAPLIVRYDIGSRYAATAARLAVLEGRLQDAARLMGYGHAAAAASGVDAEEPAEVLLRAQASAELDRWADELALAQLAREGRTLSADAAYRLALARAPSEPCTVAEAAP